MSGKTKKHNKIDANFQEPTIPQQVLKPVKSDEPEVQSVETPKKLENGEKSIINGNSSSEDLQNIENGETTLSNGSRKPQKDEAECTGKMFNAETKNDPITSIQKEEEKVTDTQSDFTPNRTSESEFDSCEMEPLLLESEEVDPELQFDENSDIESRKDSPIIRSRCKTRRSQTRNLPTPKTPKSVQTSEHSDGDDRDIDKPAPPGAVDLADIVPLLETDSTNIGATNETDSLKFDITEKENSSIEKGNIEDDDKSINEPPAESTPNVTENMSNESCVSGLSTKANAGSDVTREQYIAENEEKGSKFLESTKDMPIIEALRKVSSRRSIRPVDDYRKHLLRSSVDRSRSVSSQRSSIDRLSSTGGIKRKLCADTSSVANSTFTSSSSKRFKAATSSFFAYITSPISKLKNRFYSTERSTSAAPTESAVLASTPKLTTYKTNQDLLDDTDMSEISGNVSTSTDKKWCTLM